MFDQIITSWAVIAGLMFNMGYILSLVKLVYTREPSCVPMGTYTMFLFASGGYAGYFTWIVPDSLMSLMAISGCVLLMANLFIAVMYMSVETSHEREV